MKRPMRALGLLATSAMLLMVGASAALASDYEVSVVDVTVPSNAVTLKPGQSGPITINLRVTGSQVGTATFEVYRNWTLNNGVFTGSSPEEFTVAPRLGGDPATTFSTTGNVTVANTQAASATAFTLTLGVFDITNTNTTGAKLDKGTPGTYYVNVEAASKAATTTTLTCDAGPFHYTGSGIEPCTATVTGPGLSQSVPVTYLNNVNAGTATASASFAANDNYLGSSDSEQFTIDKAITTTTVICDAGPFSYTGSAIEPCTATVTGPNDLLDTLTVSYEDNVNAGQATASASYAGTANYSDSSDTENFTIGKASSTTTITCPVSVTYNGSAQTPCSATVMGAGGLDESLAPSYSNNTNAGTATATVNYSGDANHNGSSDTKTFTIAKASTMTTVTCAAGPHYYTGSAIEPCSANVTGAGSLSQPVNVTYSNNLKAGTATATASYAGTSNYEPSSDSETFTITGWTFTGFFQPVDMGNSVNTVKAGSTVPLKFEVFDQSGELTDVGAVDKFTWIEISCTTLATAAIDEIEQLTSGQTVLRYDTTAGQYVQNWQTPKKAGSCLRATMTTDSGTSLSAFFKLK